MKFVINKSDIRNVLGKIQGLTGRKTNLAITENVLIQASASDIKIVATDLETGFEGNYPAMVESEGMIAINSRKLYEIIREFPAEEVRFHEIENRWIEIGNENVEYHIVGMNPEDFPDNPKIEDISFFEVDSRALSRMIERTVFIVGATDDKRAHIEGTYFENTEDEDQKLLRMVSTDGSRLCAADYPYEGEEPSLESGVLIPKKGLHEVLKFLDTDEPVFIGLKDNHFVVRKGAENITIRLLEGEFPNYKELIHPREGGAIRLDRHAFMMMLKRMSIFSSEQYKGVIFNFDRDRLLLRTTNPDIGESKEEMAIAFEDESFEAAFNPKYFIDTLQVLDGDSLMIQISNGEMPCLVRGENDKTFVSVIMPMRI